MTDRMPRSGPPVTDDELVAVAEGRSFDPHAVLGQVLGFAAGAFVCIATSDLLPELQFHRHDRLSLSLALLAGIVLAWSTIFLEAGHGHSHPEPSSHEHSDEPSHDHE